MLRRGLQNRFGVFLFVFSLRKPIKMNKIQLPSFNLSFYLFEFFPQKSNHPNNAHSNKQLCWDFTDKKRQREKNRKHIIFKKPNHPIFGWTQDHHSFCRTRQTFKYDLRLYGNNCIQIFKLPSCMFFIHNEQNTTIIFEWRKLGEMKSIVFS